MINGESTDWAAVTSGVPQGSVLCPILFIIYVNDLGEGLSSKNLKFADDTQFIKRVINDKDIADMRENLLVLHRWSTVWQMPFNIEKCKVMHLGYNNKRMKYKIGEVDLSETLEESDLGIDVCAGLKVPVTTGAGQV